MSCCSETSAEVVKDPVCGMQVDPAKAAGQSQYQGLTFLFCSLGCKKKFDLNPAQYMQSDTELPLLQPKSVAVPPAAGATKVAASGKYTCPMHPQIVRDQPGSCPICGMALEPRNVTANASNPELDDMTRRFWIGVVLTIPLLAVMVSDILPGHP